MRSQSGRVKRRSKVVGVCVCAAALASLAAYPLVAKRFESDRVEERLAGLAALPPNSRPRLDTIALRVQQLGSSLRSWAVVGGCGAGSSAGSGAAVKWIGRGTSGGLFDLQLMASYLPLPKGHDYISGYNFSLTAQVTRDLGEAWNFGVMVPYLYKYYRDYQDLRRSVDVSNGGIGDVNLLLTRRFGPINATALTLTVGLPTGSARAKYLIDPLSQEKQLSLGRLTAGLTLDHTLDEVWGLILLGVSGSYRGGENRFGNYRSPTASTYAYGGYFVGPFVPALGLTLTHFFQRDRDRTLEQDMPLTQLAPSLSVEWSSDYVALLAGGSMPIGLTGFEIEPWIVGVGVTVSPF
jgi:hypothetical protein